MSERTIGFIGAGNMASAMVSGLIARGTKTSKIWMCDVDQQKLQRIKQTLKVQVTQDSQAIVRDCDTIVLAVKPQVMQQVCESLTHHSAQEHAPLFISIAAGTTLQSLGTWLGQVPIVRCMPNLTAAVQTGATGLFANERVTNDLKAVAKSVLSAIGVTLWMSEESLLDAVTAVSGSGPAYFFLVMEAMINTGIELGLTPEEAKTLTLQTALGSAQMAVCSDESPAVLRKNVTSPGGTTAAALDQFEAGGLRDVFSKAMQAARDRAEELSRG